MTTLANAPLVEVLTEFRWALATREEEDSEPTFEFTSAEKARLRARFLEIASQAGFSTVEEVDDEDDPFAPFAIVRRGVDVWPVYQIGTGTFLVNQENAGYDWPSYKADVLAGLQLLRAALEGAYEHIPFIGHELTYVDAFILEEGETPQRFLKRKLAIDVRVPPAFQGAPYFREQPWSLSFRVNYELAEPNGTLRIVLDHGTISGRDAFIMDTRVLSVGREQDYSDEGITRWLEAAHAVQRHTFETLIKPAYMRRFE